METVRPQSNLPLETFFESLTTAIRYVRYTVGIKILFDLSGIGAYRCHLYEDLHQPNVFRMEVVVSSWKEYRLQSERLTTKERDVVDKLRGLHTARTRRRSGSRSLWTGGSKKGDLSRSSSGVGARSPGSEG
jgi:hypothetical protein